ncbi:hypothetical protein [Rhabdochromatium marinum]|uniref:hypothetical protein n=1 Tax=Rhabdochromatium marinum TaxID=48729 RepID=UPI001907342C|nr:hypothetical protein [Rhabdochromatium marinum]MBK1648831.1 hypothetical protein [Rhabdochromatium marinum]
MTAAATAGIDLVRFCAGGLTFAVEANKVSAMRAPQEPLPPRLSALLQLPRSAAEEAAPRERLLDFTHPEGTRGLLVDEPVIQCHLPASTLHPLPPLMAARLNLRCVRALACFDSPPNDTLAIVIDAWHLPRPELR